MITCRSSYLFDSVTQVAVDVFGNAFGNALGNSLADELGRGSQQEAKVQLQGVGPYSAADYVNGMDLQSDNFTRNRQSQPYFDQMVGVFGGVNPYDGRQYAGVQVADAGRLTLSGVNSATSDSDDAYYARIIANAQAKDAQRQATFATGRRLDARATADLYARGAGDVRDTSPPAFNDAEMTSMRAENLARAQSIAAPLHRMKPFGWKL
jgi:hypothetical protein